MVDYHQLVHYLLVDIHQINFNFIDYVTIATLGNAQDFGDLTDARQQIAATSSLIRGVSGGEAPISNIIEL